MAILVGAASWTDKTLIDCGRFYPKEAKTPEARLRYYSSIFPMVEVDSSYYGIPAPANANNLAERTPDFIDAIASLKVFGKLGLVHFQFPPWLMCNRDGHTHVEHRMSRWPATPAASNSGTNLGLAKRTAPARLTSCASSAPSTPSSTGRRASPTACRCWRRRRTPTYALVRLHGRNVDTYNVKEAASAAKRFDYDYPDQELREIMVEVVRLAYKVRNTHLIFNNCDEDKGQHNGIAFMKMLLAHG